MAELSEKWIERLKYIYFFGMLVCVALTSYLMTKYSLFDKPPKDIQIEKELAQSRAHPLQDEPEKHKSAKRLKTGRLDLAANENGAIPNQRIIVFKDRESMESFLANMGGGLNLRGRMDKLNALLIGFGNEEDLLGMLDGSEETTYNFPVNIPEFARAGVQDGAVALRNGLLKWLGVTSDNSLWGAGVKIAILDTGIADHIAFRNAIERINLVSLSADATALNGHGTSVASLIFSDNPLAPGIAPGATPLSVRIADDNGSSSSFLIAQGIIAAVDAGAQLINISLGGSGQSALVENALTYAKQAGVVVVAAAGNTGAAVVMQPAASSSVIAVGAVDAKNQHLNFSNTGSEIAVSAPGYAVNAAYPGNNAAVVSGTSFSSPIITGTIAAAMSNSGQQTLSATQATAAMNSSLTDIGVQGSDSSTGSGVPDIWRILNGNSPGIYDAAITSVLASGNQVQILIQNLGTETMINAGVSVNINGTTTTTNITTLAAGDTRAVTVPAGGSQSLNITGSVQLSGGQMDQRPANDSISQTVPASVPAPGP
jgi:hypothetical protein